MTDISNPKDAGSIEPVDLIEAKRAKRPHLKALTAIIAVMSLGVAGIGVVALQGNNDKPLMPLGIGGASNKIGQEDAAMSSSLYRWADYRYVLAGALDDLGTEAPAYRLIAPDLTVSDVSEMATALGIDGGARVLEWGGFEASDADRTLQITGDASAWWLSVWAGPSYTSGSGSSSSGSTGSGVDGTVSVDAPIVERDGEGSITATTSVVYPECSTEPTDLPVDSPEGDATTNPAADDKCALVDPQPVDPDFVAPEPPKDLPSETEAMAIANDFLDALGLLRGYSWEFEINDYSTVSSSGSCAVSSDAPETEVCEDVITEEIVYSRSVTAHRLVDGRTVAGLDFYVEVGDLGVVTNAGGMLASLEYLGDYPLRTTAQAFEDLKSGNGGFYGRDVVALGAPEAVSSDECEGGPATDCIAPDIACDGPCPEPEIIEITVTGVSLSSQVYYTADENGAPAQYVVATYHFVGSFPDGTEWSSDVVAVTDEYIVDAPTPTEPQGTDDPAPPPSDGVTEPHPTPMEPVAFDAEADIVVGESVKMSLNLNYHCGVSTERFDAQWWDADPAWPGSGGGSPYVEATTGELVLKDDSHAYWTNGAGVEISFVPHPGEFTPLGCD